MPACARRSPASASEDGGFTALRAAAQHGEVAVLGGGEGCLTIQPADLLILQAATGQRRLSRADLARVLRHVSLAGFDPNAGERARGGLAGMRWRGRVVAGNDRLPPAERHYLLHVVKQEEWPTGTTLDEYLASIRAVIEDPTSGVFTLPIPGSLAVGCHPNIARAARPIGS